MLRRRGEQAADTLQLAGGTFDTVTFNYTNLHDGSIEVDPDGLGGTPASTVSYTELEAIASTLTATDLVLDYSDASETITVQGGGAGY